MYNGSSALANLHIDGVDTIGVDDDEILDDLSSRTLGAGSVWPKLDGKANTLKRLRGKVMPVPSLIFKIGRIIVWWSIEMGNNAP